jgi:hypothetical protein
VVDLGIAANLVRELTEEQFAEPRRTRRGGPTANRAAERSAEGPATSPQPPREGKSNRVRRTLGRLVQVRG